MGGRLCTNSKDVLVLSSMGNVVVPYYGSPSDVDLFNNMSLVPDEVAANFQNDANITKTGVYGCEVKDLIENYPVGVISGKANKKLQRPGIQLGVSAEKVVEVLGNRAAPHTKQQVRDKQEQRAKQGARPMDVDIDRRGTQQQDQQKQQQRQQKQQRQQQQANNNIPVIDISRKKMPYNQDTSTPYATTVCVYKVSDEDHQKLVAGLSIDDFRGDFKKANPGMFPIDKNGQWRYHNGSTQDTETCPAAADKSKRQWRSAWAYDAAKKEIITIERHTEIPDYDDMATWATFPVKTFIYHKFENKTSNEVKWHTHTQTPFRCKHCEVRRAQMWSFVYCVCTQPTDRQARCDHGTATRLPLCVH
jgi:hypothetical protein